MSNLLGAEGQEKALQIPLRLSSVAFVKSTGNSSSEKMQTVKESLHSQHATLT